MNERPREGPPTLRGLPAHLCPRETSQGQVSFKCFRNSVTRKPTCPSLVKNLYTTEGFPWTESPTLSPSDMLYTRKIQHTFKLNKKYSRTGSFCPVFIHTTKAGFLSIHCFIHAVASFCVSLLPVTQKKETSQRHALVESQEGM